MRKLLQLTVLLSFIVYLATAYNLTKVIRERKEICTLNYSYGSCHGAVTQWYYDFVDDRCQEFMYSTCGGNRNRFKSRSKCIEFCMDPVNGYRMQDFHTDYFY